jgi:hypothetical protein
MEDLKVTKYACLESPLFLILREEFYYKSGFCFCHISESFCEILGTVGMFEFEI